MKKGTKPAKSRHNLRLLAKHGHFTDFCGNLETDKHFSRDLVETTSPASIQPSLIMQSNGKMPRKGVTREVRWQTQKEFVLDALERHEQPLTAYAVRLLNGDLHAARDVVQHTFMQLCKQPSGKVEPKLAPWLYTVCRNRIFDELKSKSRQETTTPSDFEAIDFQAVDPANQYEREDFLRSLRQLFACLPESERDVIELWSHGLDSAEVARVLKKNPVTVRVNLHRAIKRLKQHPTIANWLERATGQVVRPDVDQPKFGSASNCSEPSTPTITGERS